MHGKLAILDFGNILIDLALEIRISCKLIIVNESTPISRQYTKTNDNKATFSGRLGGQLQGALAPAWPPHVKPAQHRR